MGEVRYKITFFVGKWLSHLFSKVYISLDLALQRACNNRTEKNLEYRKLEQKSALSRFKKVARAESSKPLFLTGCFVKISRNFEYN